MEKKTVQMIVFTYLNANAQAHIEIIFLLELAVIVAFKGSKLDNNEE